MPATRSNPLGIRRPRAAVGALAALAAGALVAVSFAGADSSGPLPCRRSARSTSRRRSRSRRSHRRPSTPTVRGSSSLEAQAGTTEFAPGVPSDTWGFNGSYLGPTLVATRGEHVRVDVANSLDVPTTVHWHGMHLPAEMDGGPHQTVEPDATWSPEWTSTSRRRRSGTTRTRTARPRRTSHRGLAGMFLVHDDAEAALAAAARVRRRRRPAHRAGHRLLGRRRARGRPRGFAGGLGDELLVNGTRGPYLDVHDELVRLRLLNASTARSLRLRVGATAARSSSSRPTAACSRHPSSSTGCCSRPANAPRCSCGSSPASGVVLRSEATAESAGMIDSIAAMNGGTDSFDVLELRAADTLDAAPDRAGATRDPAAGSTSRRRVTTRSFALDGFEINGRTMDMGRIDETVTVDTTELWIVTNTSQHAAQLPRARRAVPHRLDRRRAAAARARGLEGHGLRCAPRREFGWSLRFDGLRRSRHPVHVPLPPAVARGPGHDGPVRRRRTGLGLPR